MVFWIKKFALILGAGAFFLLLATGLIGSGKISWEVFVPACMRALAGAGFIWIVGIVVADILIKGIITDIDIDKKGLVEGGLLQRVGEINDTAVPGGTERPFRDRN